MGACDDAFDGDVALDGERFDVTSYLDAPLWIDVGGVADVRPDPGSERFTRVRLVDAEVVRGGAVPERLALLHGQVRAVLADAPYGTRFLMGVRDGVNVDRYAWALVFLRPDGSIAVPEPCGDDLYADAIRRWADAARAMSGSPYVQHTTAAFVRAMVAEPSAPEWELLHSIVTEAGPTEGPQGVQWDEVPPDRRALDVDLTPPEVLEGLEPVVVQLNLPPEWSGLELVLSTRTSLGWNEGIILDVAGVGEQPLLTAYAVPGEALEVWLMDFEAGAALGRVAEIPPDMWAQGAVRLTPLPGIATEADLRARAAAGEPAFDVTASG